MVLAHFREVGLRLCCLVRFAPSTDFLCDRCGRDLQVYLESSETPKRIIVFVRQIESWLELLWV